MKKITMEELRRLQENYGFRLCKVKGTEIVNIRKHTRRNPNLEDITLEEFEKTLKERKLAVFKSDNDFLRIMRDK